MSIIEEIKRDVRHDEGCALIGMRGLTLNFGEGMTQEQIQETMEAKCNCSRRRKIAWLERLEEPCEWVSEDMDTSIWLTGCGEEFWFDEPPEGIIYCPHCGHPAKIKAAEEDLP